MPVQTPEAFGDTILIVDFGSQVTQLIARRVRESGVYCEVHPYDKVDGILEAFAPKAVVDGASEETMPVTIASSVPFVSPPNMTVPTAQSRAVVPSWPTWRTTAAEQE